MDVLRIASDKSSADCQRAATLHRDQLIRIAVARGCLHYAAFVDAALVEDQPEIEHEVLGCALLRGEPNVETYQSIRVGTMVLSDLSNSLECMARAAEQFQVGSRLAYIATIGLAVDQHKDHWRGVLSELHVQLDSSEARFLPGPAGFSVEKIIRDEGKIVDARLWLRTAYERLPARSPAHG